METTKRVVTINGKPFILAGPSVKVGQKAPDFQLTAIDFTEVRPLRLSTMANFSGTFYVYD